jgi:hypothetical protein
MNVDSDAVSPRNCTICAELACHSVLVLHNVRSSDVHLRYQLLRCIISAAFDCACQPRRSQMHAEMTTLDETWDPT